MSDSRESINNIEDLGRLIREARKVQGLTQQQFADVAGVGVRFLSELERGKESAEVGLVLQVLTTAGFDLYLEHRSQKPMFPFLTDRID